MNLNFFEWFNRWIDERGSSRILERHLALKDERIAQLERENALLRSENALLREQLANATIREKEAHVQIDEIRKLREQDQALITELKKRSPIIAIVG